jgi:hypothetical protein
LETEVELSAARILSDDPAPENCREDWERGSTGITVGGDQGGDRRRF